MKIAIVGSRNIENYTALVTVMNEIKVQYKIEKIISGGAKGVDKMAEKWAKENNVEIEIILPGWKQHGKAAGLIRNKVIINKSNMVIALWDGKSPGTKYTIEEARKAHKLKALLLIEK